MIKSISIKNYILINELTIDFSDGLNIITGETGAGKSILINAIDIALGAKVSSDVIKKDKEKAVIEIVVVSNKQELKNLFEENEIDFSEEIIISREITQNSSRIRVNGTVINQVFIKQLKEIIIDIHSQHQIYSFLQPKTHIKFLDNYSKEVYGKELNEYKNLYTEYLQLNKTLKEAKSAADYTESQIDFLKFQLNEIEEAQIEDINEYENLQNEISILENAEKLKEYTESAYWIISGDDANLIDTISRIKTNISKAAGIDSSLEEVESEIIELSEQAKNISVFLRKYSQTVSDNTEKLNQLQDRLFVLNKIKRKYGTTLEEVLNTYQKLSKELQSIEVSTEIIDKTENKIKKLHKFLTEKSQYISEQRKIQAEKLSVLIEKELEKLELPKSRFKINFDTGELSYDGTDIVEFYISTNISGDLQPLSKTASGGELSRIMLAIKTIFAEADNTDTVIFDEIDTGISGKAAQSVAEEIEKLAKFRQIILITHQGIIAAKADLHIGVTKTQDKETTVDIRILDEKQKISAIAKLVSGAETSKSVELAKSLLKK